VPLLKFATNRFPPDTAMPSGKFNPEIKALSTVVPEVVYSPIVPLLEFETNRFPPDNAILNGLFNPEIKALLTVAPEVVYSPIVPLLGFVSKICARAVPGMAQSAAEATKPERINRIILGAVIF